MSSNNTPKTSISDLVPLVVAVLKDQAVTDKIEELQQQLNNANYERLLVQVTGPGGTPVYYQGSLKDGGTCESDMDDGKVWMMYFRKKKDDNNNKADKNVIVVPLNLIGELEIRFGGHLVLFMSDTTTSTNLYNIDEECDRNYMDYINSNEPQTGSIHFSDKHGAFNSPIHYVHGRIGPVPWSDYKMNDNHRSKFDNMAWYDLRNYANDDSNPTQDLIITAIEFNKDLFGESINSLLEKMGTSTINVYNESWMRSVRSIGLPPVPISGEEDAAANADAADEFSANVAAATDVAADAAADANAAANAATDAATDADADADADAGAGAGADSDAKKNENENENENNKKQKRKRDS